MVALSPGFKRPEQEADRSPSSSVEAKNDILSHVLMTFSLIKHRSTCIFISLTYYSGNMKPLEPVFFVQFMQKISCALTCVYFCFPGEAYSWLILRMTRGREALEHVFSLKYWITLFYNRTVQLETRRPLMTCRSMLCGPRQCFSNLPTESLTLTSFLKETADLFEKKKKLYEKRSINIPCNCSNSFHVTPKN
jgi:hypothetical protein